MKWYNYLLKRYWALGIVGFLLISLSIIPIQLALAFYQAPEPQTILTLGGGDEREKFTAEFAQNYPNLDIWVSTGIPPQQANAIFLAAGIPVNRVHLDYRASDTVTNFTTLVTNFKQRGIKHVYLITSDFHMPRAKAIATLVFGSQGIAFTPISIPSNKPRESMLRILRDSGRSLLWIVSGRTGASLNSHLHSREYAFR